MLRCNLKQLSGIRYIHTSTTKSSQDIDEAISKRNSVSDNEVQIEDSLIDKYNLELFNDENTDLNNQYQSEQLFLEESNSSESHVSSAYQDLFIEDTTYHQQMEADNSTNYLLLLWITIMIMIIIVVSKIIKIKRKNAN